MELTREKCRVGRREARRIDRRDAILTVAYASFLEHGYAATTMSGIAATIGGSKATLWSYFPSKEALLEAVLDRATAVYRAQMSSLLNVSGDPTRTLRTFCNSFIERVTSPEAIALFRLACAESGRFPEMGKIFHDRGPRTIQNLLGAFIASAMERGLLRRDDPIRAARILISLCMSGSHQRLLLGRLTEITADMIAADADAAFDVFVRAYAA